MADSYFVTLASATAPFESLPFLVPYLFTKRTEVIPRTTPRTMPTI